VNGNSNNVIAGNFIGLGADGVTPLGETIGIYMRQSSGANRVAPTSTASRDELERNVIGNCYSGVGLYEYGSANAIVGNWIGVDANGAPAANVRGIFLSDSGAGRLIDYNRIESNTTASRSTPEVPARSTRTREATASPPTAPASRTAAPPRSRSSRTGGAQPTVRPAPAPDRRRRHGVGLRQHRLHAVGDERLSGAGAWGTRCRVGRWRSARVSSLARSDDGELSATGP